MVLSVHIKLRLDILRQKFGQDSSFMEKIWGTKVPNGGIFAEAHAYAHNLLGQNFQVVSHKIPAFWVVKCEEGRRLAEGEEMRFAREKINRENSLAGYETPSRGLQDHVTETIRKLWNLRVSYRCPFEGNPRGTNQRSIVSVHAYISVLGERSQKSDI